MRRKLFCVAVLLAAQAGGAELEVTPPARVTPPDAFTFYNPTGITIGNYLYLYLQGGGAPEDDASCDASSDKIVAFRAPIRNGVPGDFERVGRISPCVNAPVTDPSHPAHPNPPASFGPGQIFRTTIGGARKYHLLADVSETVNFFNVWRAESADGINWTWFISDDINNQQFNGRRETIRDRHDAVAHTIDIVVRPQSFIHSSGVAILNPILLPNGNGNDVQWWGFFNFWNGHFAIGEMSVDWEDGGKPVVKVVESVDGSKYRWRTLRSSDGGFVLDFAPWAFRTRANAKTLLYDPAFGGHQLWATDQSLGQYGRDVNCDTSKVMRCEFAGDCPTGDGGVCPQGHSCNAFLSNTGERGEVPSGDGSGFVWFAVSRFSFGPAHVVGSRTRFLPSGYAEARLFPFRWNSPTGRRYLFSATNDANICDELLFSAFYKMYVVRTELRAR